MKRKQILFELNEVPFPIIDYFCQQFPDSKLAEILPKSSQYETYTTDQGHLSPWITWPTLHRGVDNQSHGIHDFGEDLSEPDDKYPPIWKVLHQHGVSTGVFASMHSYPVPNDYKNYSFYVPDPFAGGSETNPQNVEPFQNFNLVMSRKSGRNVDSGIDMKSASAMALSMPAIGIRFDTLLDVAMQVVKERITPWIKTRRRTYQTVLAFDVYMKLLKKNKPQFSTYFSNHVASSMHRYWAATFPNQYKEFNLPDEWKETYKDEIAFTMQKTDKFLRKLVPFVEANPEYQLIICSSMGQKATRAEHIFSEVYCRNIEDLVSGLGLKDGEWSPRPAMHPQSNFDVLVDGKADEIEAKLQSIEIKGRKLRYRREESFFSIDLGHSNMKDEFYTLNGEKRPFSELGLTNESIEDETGATAYHIPEGSMIIFDPLNKTPNSKRERVLSTAIAPSIIENFGLDVPDYLSEERVQELVGT